MFVALSRAKQYETVICGHKPSAFMKGLSSEDYEDIPSVDTDIKSVSEGLIDAPPKAVYEKRCSKLECTPPLDVRPMKWIFFPLDWA